MIFFKIIGLVFLILLAIFLIGITIKMGVQVLWREKSFILRIRLGVFTIQLIPWKKKRRKPQKTEKNKTGHKFTGGGLQFKNLNLDETIPFLMRLMEELKDTVVIERLHLDLMVAGKDAAKTAILYGEIWEAVGLLDPVLDRCFQIRDKRVRIGCNFEEEKMRFQGEISLATRVIHTLFVMLKERKDLWKMYRKLTKKEEVTHA